MRAGNQRQLRRFATFTEALVESADDWVVPCSYDCSHVQLY
jgi:hypothetical protein